MKAIALGLIASSLLNGSVRSERMRPDVRHWAEDIYAAAPRYEDHEDFLSDLNVDEDFEDLKEAQSKQIEELKKLEEIDLSKESSGRGFLLAKQLVETSLKISTFQRMMAEREIFFKSKDWRLQDVTARNKIPKQSEIESHSFKTVGFARNLVNNYTFEQDRNQYLLIRLLARTQNSNLFLFLDQFKKRFPNSSFMSHVNLALAEYYFQLKEYDKAEGLLKAIMDNKTTAVRPYAIYKLAWVHIMRTQNEKDSAKRMAGLEKAAVALRLTHKLMNDWDAYKPAFKLKEEAAVDLAWVFAEMRSPKADVQKYFEDNKPKAGYHTYLVYLAVDAIRDGDSKLAESAFAEYLPNEVESRYYPRDLMSQIDLFIQTRSFDKVLEGYKKIRALFEEDNPWMKEWRKDKQLVESYQKQLSNHLILTASKIQQEAEKMGSQPPPKAVKGQPVYDASKLMVISKSYYDLFMDWYPNSDAQDEARYNYALLVFQNGEMERAIQLLTKIANDTKSEHRRDAAYSLVVAAANWDSTQPVPKLPDPGKAKNPVPLTKSKSTLVEKIDFFHKNWPEDEQNIPALYTAAQTLFEFGHYEDAMRRFDGLVKLAPKTEQGEAALNTLLSYYVEVARWDDLITICKQYLANKTVASSGHRKLIRQTLDYAKSQKPQ
jgi:TolA-binding protein